MRSGQYSQRKAAGGGTAGAAPMDANTAAALRNAEVLFETRSIAEIRQVNPHDPLPGPMMWHHDTGWHARRQPIRCPTTMHSPTLRDHQDPKP